MVKWVKIGGTVLACVVVFALLNHYVFKEPITPTRFGILLGEYAFVAGLVLVVLRISEKQKK